VRVQCPAHRVLFLCKVFIRDDLSLYFPLYFARKVLIIHWSTYKVLFLNELAPEDLSEALLV
jgi:hypothetical protein